MTPFKLQSHSITPLSTDCYTFPSADLSTWLLLFQILLWVLLALGYLNEWLAYFLLLLCYSTVTAGPANVSICQTKHYAQSLLRCSVALNNSAVVCRLARSQSVYSESGPAVHFFLWITVHTPLVNTHTEWVHWCRQETIHCSHVFTGNMDKL